MTTGRPDHHGRYGLHEESLQNHALRLHPNLSPRVVQGVDVWQVSSLTGWDRDGKTSGSVLVVPRVSRPLHAGSTIVMPDVLHTSPSCRKKVIVEGSLEVKFPTIWTDERHRWEESEERRKEKRREQERQSGKIREDQRRERVRRKKMQAREKLEKSRFTAFLH